MSTSFVMTTKKQLPTRAERFSYELEQDRNGQWEITLYDRSRISEEQAGYIGTLNGFYSPIRALDAAKAVADIYTKDFFEELHREDPVLVNGASDAV